MLAIFLQTLPFFALIALGYLAGKRGMFGPQATAALTGFVFYFALSAMLFRFAAQLSFKDVLDWTYIGAYLSASVCIYLLATAVALLRRRGVLEAAIEAQCAIIGNVGFLGVPMLVMLMGEAAIGPVMLSLAVDLIVFSSLIVVIITGSRDGRMSITALRTVGFGILKNPMVMSMGAGLAWSAAGWTLPDPATDLLVTLGNAATPCALFAIGASLAGKSAERLSIALWLSLCKLVLHPAAVFVSAFLIFPVDGYEASVMVACAALPVAGNVYILAQHYGVAPHRVSTAILLTTIFSVATLPAVIAFVTGF
jgi:malonate transporter